MKRGREKSTSVFRRIVIPLLFVLFLQAAVLFSVSYAGGIFSHIRQNAMDMLMDRTRNKYQILQSELANWSMLESMGETVNAQVKSTLILEGKTHADIETDAALNAKIVESVSRELISKIRQETYSGIFLVLNGAGVSGKPDTYAGMHIRDTTPANHLEDNSDLHLLRGLPPLSRKLGLALDSFWKACFTFEADSPSQRNDFFFTPLRAATQSPVRVESKYLGYWSGAFSMNPQDAFPVFTYSVPMIAMDGTCYGVLGAELSVNYVTSILNGGDTRSRDAVGSYFLGITEDGGQTYRPVLATGTRFKQAFLQGNQLMVTRKLDESFVVLESELAEDQVYGAVLPLTMYNRNTVFIGQQWALIGLQSESTLFAFLRQYFLLMGMVMLVTMLMGMLMALVTARRMAKPITGLVGELRGSDPGEELKLRHTGIVEIDVLADAVTVLNRAAAEEASKISKIISLTGLSIGVFELRGDSELAFCSDGFFALLGSVQSRKAGNRISKEECTAILREKLSMPLPGYLDVYEIENEAEIRYISCRIFHDAHSEIGTLMDVTDEVEKRKRIEHERDYDALTDIFNRRAFEQKVGELFEKKQEEMRVAALLMIDLDNFKSINDAYGHDYGDIYIRAFAGALEYFRMERSILARRSGDEFYVFFYGYESKDELRALIQNGWARVGEQNIRMPDGVLYKLRASGGIAWYPDDSGDFSQLVHFADFAMYMSKNTVKGTLEEFSREHYRADGYLFNGHEALNRLLDSQLVRYALQPIVSARTGEVFGYELLMRSLVTDLPTPSTILRLAKEMGKLYYVEQITWFKGLETVRRLRQEGKLDGSRRIFLNSIANQMITKEDERRLLDQYAELLPGVILEVTESEDKNVIYTRQKLSFVRKHGGQVAIDDFGTGYNSDASLIMIDADYVKLDMSFVQGVDMDDNKRELIRNLIKYAKQRGICVLAEGVETVGEMETLIRLGVNYLQGYYLGRPESEPLGPSPEVKEEIQALALKYQRGRRNLKGPELPIGG